MAKKLIVSIPMYPAMGRTNDGERRTNESADRLELFRELTQQRGEITNGYVTFIVRDDFNIPETEIRYSRLED